MGNFVRLTSILLFRIMCWCLVTSSLELNNLLIGLLVCILIPFGDFRKLKVHALIPEILLIFRLPYDMLKESFQLISIKEPVDYFRQEPMSKRALNGSKLAEFFDIFRITFTPMSLVTRRDNFETWRVHVVTSSKDHDLKQQNKETNQ